VPLLMKVVSASRAARCPEELSRGAARTKVASHGGADAGVLPQECGAPRAWERLTRSSPHGSTCGRPDKPVRPFARRSRHDVPLLIKVVSASHGGADAGVLPQECGAPRAWERLTRSSPHARCRGVTVEGATYLQDRARPPNIVGRADRRAGSCGALGLNPVVLLVDRADARVGRSSARSGSPVAAQASATLGSYSCSCVARRMLP
jgi:hypothetical protein